MNDNTPILSLTFRDAVTGQETVMRVSFEQWDVMTVVGERIIADWYKRNNLKKDIK